MLVWIMVYHLGFREGFVIDNFKSKQSCEAAILQVSNDPDSIWRGTEWSAPHCIGVKK